MFLVVLLLLWIYSTVCCILLLETTPLSFVHTQTPLGKCICDMKRIGVFFITNSFITLLPLVCNMGSTLFQRFLLAFLLLPHACRADVIFTTVILMDSWGFTSDQFSKLVFCLTSASSFVLHSVESDTITGAQGKALFEDISGFYSFQLLHVTRVRASIQVEDEKTASVILRRSLPHEAALRSMGVMGVESVEFGEAGQYWQQWFTTTYLELPSFAAQYLILGWVLTVLGFMTCVACYCCCCVKPPCTATIPQQPPSHVVTGVPWPAIDPHQRPPPTVPTVAEPTAPDLPFAPGNRI